MIHRVLDRELHRRPPMLAGKSDLDKQVSLHLIDMVENGRGWGLAPESPSWAECLTPWILAAAMVVTVVIVKWM